MKKNYIITALFVLLATNSFAQYKTVIFNYDQSYFNQGQALPAESKLMLTGDAGQQVGMVEVLLFSSSNLDRDPIYTATWKRGESNSNNTFSLPMNYPLRGNETYSFKINYYNNSTTKQQRQLLKDMNGALDAYIDQGVLTTKRRIKLRKHPRGMVTDMNEIVKNGMFYYRNRIQYNFTGFSDIVLEKLYQLRKLKLKNAEYNVADENGNVKMNYVASQTEALKTMVRQELAQFTNSNLLMVVDTKTVLDYSTEKTRNVLAVNVGYAGVYNEGGFDNLSSGNAPFVGLSFPLGKKAFNPFWSRASVSAGVFLQNIKFSETNTATGPIIDRPIYLALGYRALPFIRINAGATLLQSDKLNTSIGSLNTDKLYIRPFVGLSIEFNLWLGLNK